jgi:hypothetical protein
MFSHREIAFSSGEFKLGFTKATGDPGLMDQSPFLIEKQLYPAAGSGLI